MRMQRAIEDRPRTYSVYVRFGDRRRLALRRRIRSYQEALTYLQAQRELRFHAPEAVFLVDDASGEPVDDQTAPRASEAEPCWPAPEPPASAPPSVMRGMISYERSSIQAARLLLQSSAQRMSAIFEMILGRSHCTAVDNAGVGVELLASIDQELEALEMRLSREGGS
jgi:hypothetical protein